MIFFFFFFFQASKPEGGQRKVKSWRGRCRKDRTLFPSLGFDLNELGKPERIVEGNRGKSATGEEEDEETNGKSLSSELTFKTHIEQLQKLMKDKKKTNLQ